MNFPPLTGGHVTRKWMMFFRRTAIYLLAAFALASCNGAATPVETASATASPLEPTATFTPVPSMTGTPKPAPSVTTSATATSTATPQLVPQVNPGMNAYCRKGPGTSYDAITFLSVGTFYKVIGRNSLNTWWLVQAAANVNCWMGDPTAVFQGPVEQVPVVLVPPLPTRPSSFVASYTCAPELRSLQVVLDWTLVPGAIGYRIYRNASLIIELGPNVKAYRDNSSPLGVELVYELEAFNEYGVAPRISYEISACGD
jgi:hypothetical protein